LGIDSSAIFKTMTHTILAARADVQVMSPKKIPSLTPEQMARRAEYVARWTEIDLCTDPADRPRAEAAIREMYRQCGLTPPAKIVWCGSPMSMALTRATIRAPHMIDKNAEISRSVAESVENSVRESAGDSGDSVYQQVDISVWHSVKDSVENRLTPIARNCVDSILSSIWLDATVNVWHSIAESVRETVHDAVVYQVYRSDRAAWLAVHRYLHDVVGLVEETVKLSGRWELAQSAGWALPHQKICWVSERPNILHRDDRGRLHCDTGPAVAFPDGWTIYAALGVRVPRDVIERPDTITTAAIDGERNAEIRRVMIERYRHGEEVSGAAAYIRDAGGEQLDRDDRYGTLWRRDFPGGDDEQIVMIELANSTPEPDGARRPHWVRVPPKTTTARKAWTFSQSGRTYNPRKES